MILKSKKIFKRVIIAVCCVALILGSCICLSAVPTLTGVNWYTLDNLSSVEHGQKEMVFNIVVNNTVKSLKLSFPSTGGIRLVNEYEGYFLPSSLNYITYTRNLDGTLSLSAGTGTTAKVNINSYPWSIKVLDSNNVLKTEISGDELWYGLRASTIEKIAFENSLDSGEVIYGLGERFNSLNRVGYKTEIFNRDCWSEGDNAYKNIPIIHSSKGYSLFYNCSAYATADIGYTDASLYTYEAYSNKLDLYIWAGTPVENLNDYTDLTGKPMEVPKWAFRFMPGAATSGWNSNGEGNALSLMKSSLIGYAAYGLDDFDAIFGEAAFLKNEEAYSYLNGKGIRMLGWVAPFQVNEIETALKYLPNASTDFADYELPMFKTSAGYSTVDTVDFSHPAAKDLITALWKDDIALGLRGLMLDYGEYIGTGSETAYNGMDRYEMHNFNSYYYAKTYYEVFNELAGEGEWLNYMRSAAAGAQAYTTNFCGDQYSTWDGLSRALTGMLSLSASGFSTMGADIGGHSGGASTELYDRWLQLVTFNPLMRAHGKEGAENPWDQGTMSIFLDHYWLRENLIDQIYSASIEANKTGTPMVQSMAVAFPGRESLLSNQDQYLFTEDLLVAPVLASGVTSRSVELPSGTWTDLRTGTNYEGDNTYTMAAPREYIPVLIRSGSVMPVTVSSNTLSLFTDMEDDKKTNAFIVTAPNGSRTSDVWTDSSNGTTFTSAANGSAFTVSASKSQSTRVILVYGVKATGVSVNGVSLSKLSSSPTSTSSTGYYVNGSLCTVIRVPSDWTNITISTDGSNDMAEVEDETQTSTENAVVDLPAGSDESYTGLNAADDALKAEIAEDFDVYYSNTATTGSLAKVDFEDHFEFDTNGLRHIPTEVIEDNADMWAKKKTNVTTLVYNKGQYENFELTARIGGSIKNGGADPLNTGDWLSADLIFGIKNPTKWQAAGSGYNAGINFNLNQLSVAYINRFNTSSGEVEALTTDSNLMPNFVGWKHEFTFKLRVENGVATVTMDKTDYGESYFNTVTFELPDDYSGGQVGIKFMTDSTRVYSIEIKNLDTVDSSGGSEEVSSVDYGDLTAAATTTQSQIQSDFGVYYSIAAKDGVLDSVSFTDHFEFTSEGLVHKPTETLSTTKMVTNITTMIYNKAEFENFELRARVKGSTTTSRIGVIFGVDDPTKWWVEPYGYKTSITYSSGNRSYPYIRYYDESADSLKLITGERSLAFSGYSTEFDYIVKVKGNKLTVTVDYTAWGGTSYSQELTIPDTYDGGRIGLVFVPDTTQIKSLSIRDITGVKVACVGDDVTALGYDATGTTASETDSYPNILQGILGDDYTVYNFGSEDASASSTVVSSCRVGGESSVFNASLSKAPDVVVINYGASDALADNWGVGNTTGITAKEHFKGELLSLAAAYKQALPNAKIYIATSSANYGDDATYLANLAQVVEAQKEVANQLGIGLIDINAVTVARKSWFPNGEIPDTLAGTYIADEIAYAVTGKAYLGDINDDGAVDNADMEYMNKFLLGAEGFTASDNVDLNLDGKVDLIDCVALKKLIKARS